MGCVSLDKEKRGRYLPKLFLTIYFFLGVIVLVVWKGREGKGDGRERWSKRARS